MTGPLTTDFLTGAEELAQRMAAGVALREPEHLRAGYVLLELVAEVQRLTALLNTPEFHDFAKAVALEAAHQRERWGDAHDAAKEPEDWFWTLGYLAGKALAAAKAGDREKALHHTISSAALLNNWHRRLAQPAQSTGRE